MESLDYLFGQYPRLHTTPLAVELHQLRPRHILAWLLATIGIVSEECIPATPTACDPHARAYVDTQAYALDGLHRLCVEDLNRAGHWYFGVVGVCAVELAALDKTAVDVANLIFVGFVPSGDRVARKGKLGYVVVLDGIEVVFIYGYTLHSIIGIETRHLSEVAVAVNLLRHNVMANQGA